MNGELVCRVRAGTRMRVIARTVHSGSPRPMSSFVTNRFRFSFRVPPVTSLASLLGDLGHGRHQLLRARRPKHISSTFWNLREAPANDPLPVQ